MVLRRWVIVLTLLNLGLLATTLAVLAAGRAAAAPDVPPVLRGRALEIVDARGRVRASVVVQPAGVQPGGASYPETVILRLIDEHGRPEVKLVASVQGGAVGFVGEHDETQAQLSAMGATAALRLANTEGRALLFRP